ncbi:MAG: MBG domain-containing protein [Bacilli bacterium]|nr:MBG domain-containing protein [Bacilli bacterium]
MKKISLLMFLALFLVSCGPTNQNTSSPSSSSSPSSELKEFSNLTFNSKEVTYDGSAHSLIVNNAPNDASIIYQNNEHIDAGTYNVSATVSKSGYKTTILEATLTILKAPIKGISFEDQTFEYDAK